MKTKRYFLLSLFSLGLFVLEGHAQLRHEVQDSSMISGHKQSVDTLDFSNPFDFKNSARLTVLDTYGGQSAIPRLNHLPGIFCKLEYKMETRSKLAPRFRLGSLQYANWMEGKLPGWSSTLK